MKKKMNYYSISSPMKYFLPLKNTYSPLLPFFGELFYGGLGDNLN